jgi:hypothetical protein
MIYGDYVGYLYEDGVGTNDGIEIGYNGNPSTTATAFTLTDSSGTFITTDDGLRGLFVTILSGQGEGQTRRIESNTSQVLTLATAWTTVPTSASTYTIGGIAAHWRSKDYDFGGHDIVKLFRHVTARVREEGAVNLDLHYIVDFKELARATKKALSLLGEGFTWGTSTWGSARWGRSASLIQKVSLRNTTDQRLNGNHFAVRFSNAMANQTFRLSGFDIEFKAVGKR